MARKAKITNDAEDIIFFNEIDLKRDGTISSEYPCWFFDTHISEMQEGIDSKERQLKLGLVHPEMIGRVQAELERDQKRLDEIKASKPMLRGKAKNFAYSEYQKIAGQLSESMPTRREDAKGFVNAHDEYKRLNTPHIAVDPKIAEACGFHKTKGKLTAKQASKCYQIIGKALGENTNVERLRKDGGVESFKTMDGLTAKILERLTDGARIAQDEGR